MPFYLDGRHPSAVSWWPDGAERPVHLTGQPYRPQSSARRAYLNYYEREGIPAPFAGEIDAERLAEEGVRPPAPPPPPNPWANAAVDGLDAFANMMMHPIPAPRRRAVRPPQAPQEAAEGYRAPSEVMIEGITKQPFFMPYDTLQEIRLRLRNTVIKVDGTPVHVLDVTETRNREFEVIFRFNEEEATLRRTYSKENGFDLAPLPARYVFSQSAHRNANWVYRTPARGVYQQGGNRSNTFIRRSGDGAKQTVGSEMNIVRAYVASNRILGVGEAFGRIGEHRSAMPCSDHVAVYAYNRKCGVEYHGIQLSEFSPADISNGCLKINTTIPLTPLMEKRLNEVGISIVI